MTDPITFFSFKYLTFSLCPIQVFTIHFLWGSQKSLESGTAHTQTCSEAKSHMPVPHTLLSSLIYYYYYVMEQFN